MKYYYVNEAVQAKNNQGDWLDIPLVVFMVAGDTYTGCKYLNGMLEPVRIHRAYKTYEEAVHRARDADARLTNAQFAHPVFEIERPEYPGSDITFTDIEVPLSASLEHINPEIYRRVDLSHVKLSYVEEVYIRMALDHINENNVASVYSALQYYANKLHINKTNINWLKRASLQGLVKSFSLGATAIAMPLIAYVAFPTWVAYATLLLSGLAGFKAYQNFKEALPSETITDREQYYKKIVETIEDINRLKSDFEPREEIQNVLNGLLRNAPPVQFDNEYTFSQEQPPRSALQVLCWAKKSLERLRDVPIDNIVEVEADIIAKAAHKLEKRSNKPLLG